MKTELVLLSLSLASSVFTAVNSFTEWVNGTYSLCVMMFFLLAHWAWCKYYYGKV